MDYSLHATMQHQDDKPISANNLLEQIKAGSERWLMPWHKGLEAPTNPVTGNLFKGRNADLLWKAAIQKGVNHNQWATLKQWRKLKGKVRIRSKGTRIFKPKTFDSMDLFGKETPILTGFNSYYVFNEQDIDNYNPEHPDLFTAHKHYVTDHDALNQLIEKSQAVIHYGGHRAVYFPASDEIFMPKRSSFVSTARATANESFYSTLLHELVHWTGHHSRLARGVYFGVSELDYAYEELIAELGAVILCGDFGVHLAPKQENAAYLRSWLKVLEDDIDNFYNAFASAQNAVNWLYLHTGVYPRSKSQEPEPDQETDSAIVQLLQQACDIYSATMPDRVFGYIADYINILKRHVMQDDEAIKLAQKIYQNHREALDFIFEHKPDRLLEVDQIFAERVKQRGYILGSPGKGYTRFLTKELDPIVPRNSERGWPQKEAFLYEFGYGGKKIYFRAVVAPGEQAFRQNLIDILAQVDGARKTNSQRWSSVHTAIFSHELTSEKYQDDELLVKAIDKALDEIEPIVEKTSERLAKQLPAIEEP